MIQHDEIEPPQNPLNAYGASAASRAVGDSAMQPTDTWDQMVKSRKDRKEKMRTELDILFGGNSQEEQKSGNSHTINTGDLDAEIETLFSADTEDKKSLKSSASIKSPSSKASAAGKSSEKTGKAEVEGTSQEGFLSSLMSWASPSTTRSGPLTKEDKTDQSIPVQLTDTTFHRDPKLDDDELSRAIAESIKTNGMDEELVPVIRELAEMKLVQASVISAPNAAMIVHKGPPRQGFLPLMTSCFCIPTQANKPATTQKRSLDFRKDKRNWRLGDYDYDDDNDDVTRNSDGSVTRYSNGSVAFSSVYSESICEDVSVDDDTTDSFSVGGSSANLYSFGDDTTNVFSKLGSTFSDDANTVDYSSDGESFSYCDSDEEHDDGAWEVVSVFELPVVDVGSAKLNKWRYGRKPTKQSKTKQRQPRLQPPPQLRKLKRLYTLEEEDVSPNGDGFKSIDEDEIDYLESLVQPMEDARAVEDALAVVKQHAKRLGIDEKELLKAVEDAEANDSAYYEI
jgi:hypothetical protein